MDYSINDDEALLHGPAPDLIIKGGIIITMKEDQAPISDARVLIRKGRITDICKKNEYCFTDRHTEVIDAGNAIIMPGLINTHTHLAMTLFRGVSDDLPLKQWLYEKIFPLEGRWLNPENVYWASLLGCAEMIASGTTCMADGYFFEDETVRAVHQSGLRGLIAQGVLDFPAPGVADPKDNLKIAGDFIEKWRNFSDNITPGMFCHSPLTCSEQTLKNALKISKRFDVPLQIHLSETQEEVDEIVRKTGKRPVHYLNQLGLLCEDLIAAHAVHLDEMEIVCLKDNGAKIVHVPESNMKLSSGVSRAAYMLGAGLTVGLGTDGCASNNNLDMFCEMDTAAKLAKVMSNDPTALNAKTVLKMATSYGAAVLGLENEIGTIEPGKLADIVVVDLNSPHLCPVYDPISTLVYSAKGSDVRDVIVNGKVLMKDRKIISLDTEEIMERVENISTKIY
jgi:5-methylthioadenosine/S-adenosylhomocysteine deaminase